MAGSEACGGVFVSWPAFVGRCDAEWAATKPPIATNTQTAITRNVAFQNSAAADGRNRPQAGNLFDPLASQPVRSVACDPVKAA